MPPIAGVAISGVTTSEARARRGKTDRRTNGVRERINPKQDEED